MSKTDLCRDRGEQSGQVRDRGHDVVIGDPAEDIGVMIADTQLIHATHVKQAADRIRKLIRTTAASLVDTSTFGDARVWLVHEYLQHTGTFKARGAANFTVAHAEAGRLTSAGITIASGGNAGLACAWAAKKTGVPATVFLPETAPAFKVGKLLSYGAEVRKVGTEYADALAACRAHVRDTDALMSHAYDHPLIAAGAGTLLAETVTVTGGIDTIIVAVGGAQVVSIIVERAAALATPLQGENFVNVGRRID